MVIEAARRPGSLTTARLAGEQGHEIFAVPGLLLDPRFAGTNDLIRQVAVLTEGASEVTTALEGVLSRPLSKGSIGNEFSASPRPPADETELEKVRKEIVERLGPTPVEVDELIRQCQVSASLAPTVLLELELAGRRDRYPGNKFSIHSEEC